MTRFCRSLCVLIVLLIGGDWGIGAQADDHVHRHHRRKCDGPCCQPLPKLPYLPKPKVGTAQLTVRVPEGHRLKSLQIVDNTAGATVIDRHFDEAPPVPLIYQQVLSRRAHPRTYTVQVSAMRLGTIHHAQRPATLALGKATTLWFLPSHFAPLATANATVAKPARVRANLVVLYEFKEGSGTMVHDVSKVGNPVNLSFGGQGAHWVPNGGLRIEAPTLIKSPSRANKIVDAVKQTGELTIEAWIQPRDRFQGTIPPARIVTLSQDTANRNFTLGQDGDRYVVRVRTGANDRNGTAHSIRSGSYSVQPDKAAHVVLTFARRRAKLYVNGQEVTDVTTRGSLAHFNDQYHFALGNELRGPRAWLGRYYLVAIYNRALRVEDVVQHYGAGY